MSNHPSKPVPVKVSKCVHFNCGCIAERPLVGLFSDIHEWHITPCFAHTQEIESLGFLAEMAFNEENGDK